MQYRRSQPLLVSAWCRRQVMVLLAVTKVRGFGAARPHASGVRPRSCVPLCGLADRAWSAVIALCSPRCVCFVVLSVDRGDGAPSGTLAARAARSAA